MSYDLFVFVRVKHFSLRDFFMSFIFFYQTNENKPNNFLIVSGGHNSSTMDRILVRQVRSQVQAQIDISNKPGNWGSGKII